MSFQHPRMLWWAVAALLPILLHHWMRQRPKAVAWPAMRLLRQSMTSRAARRGHIRNWILLALRTLLMILLAMALADPNWSAAPSASIPTHARQSWLLVFDTSASTAYTSLTQSRLRGATEESLRWIHQLPLDAEVTVIDWCDTSSIVATPGQDRSQVVKALHRLEAKEGKAEWLPLLSLLQRQLDKPAAVGAASSAPQVLIFSDFAGVPWRRMEEPAIREGWEKISKMARIRVMALTTTSPVSNIGILSCQVVTPTTVIQGDRVTLAVILRREGSGNAERLLSIWHDESLYSQTPIRLSEDGEQTLRVQMTIPNAAPTRIRLQLDTDGLPCDNEYYLVLPARAAVQVLCVGDAARVSAALNPDPDRYHRFIVTSASIAELDATPLESYDGLVIADVADITAARAARIDRFLKGGGGVVCFLGPQCDPATYNAHLVSEDHPHGFLTARLLSARESPDAPWDTGEERHPMLYPFRDRPRAGLRDAPVLVYRQLEPLPGLDHEVPIRFANADPLVLATNLGAGRVVLVATAASEAGRGADGSTPWSLWSTWPSFPPFIHQVVSYAVARSQDLPSYIVSDSLRLPLPSEDLSNLPHARRGQDIQSLHIRHEGASRELELPRATSAGFYSFEQGNRSLATFAVNVDRSECLLDTVPVEQLPNFVQSTVTPVSALLSGEPPSEAAHSAGLPTGTSHFLLALMLLLVGETWLARTVR